MYKFKALFIPYLFTKDSDNTEYFYCDRKDKIMLANTMAHAIIEEHIGTILKFEPFESAEGFIRVECILENTITEKLFGNEVYHRGECSDKWFDENLKIFDERNGVYYFGIALHPLYKIETQIFPNSKK